MSQRSSPAVSRAQPFNGDLMGCAATANSARKVDDANVLDPPSPLHVCFCNIYNSPWIFDFLKRTKSVDDFCAHKAGPVFSRPYILTYNSVSLQPIKERTAGWLGPK